MLRTNDLASGAVLAVVGNGAGPGLKSVVRAYFAEIAREGKLKADAQGSITKGKGQAGSVATPWMFGEQGNHNATGTTGLRLSAVALTRGVPKVFAATIAMWVYGRARALRVMTCSVRD